jgi:hypothetical protein
MIFIHDLWIHSAAWQPWVELFQSAGYGAITHGWPGDSATVEAARGNADASPRPSDDKFSTVPPRTESSIALTGHPASLRLGGYGPEAKKPLRRHAP